MILIDSNVPMYLVGAAHPHKVDAQQWVEKLLNERRRLVPMRSPCTRSCIAMWPSIAATRSNRRSIPCRASWMGSSLFDLPAIERTKQIVLGYQRFSARDAVHLAVMEQHGVG